MDRESRIGVEADLPKRRLHPDEFDLDYLVLNIGGHENQTRGVCAHRYAPRTELKYSLNPSPVEWHAALESSGDIRGLLERRRGDETGKKGSRRPKPTIDRYFSGRAFSWRHRDFREGS